MFKQMFAKIPQLLRIKQWIKNLLVIVPFFAAGIGFTWTNSKLLLLGFISFCFSSSLIYIVNDWHDRESDRLHETKSRRPIASGDLSGRFVIAIGLLLFCLILLVIFQLNLKFILVVLVYALNSLIYTFYLKKIAVLEFMSVSLGFILRGYAGAAIFSIRLSSWFLIVIWFSSLYLILGKRHSEFIKYGKVNNARQVLNEYSLDFLKDAKLVSLSAALTAYCSWALYEKSENIFSLVSVIPATIFFMTYSIKLDKGQGESPETIMLGSRIILFCLGALLFLLYLSSS